MVDSDRKNVIVVLESKGDEGSDDNFEIGFSNENGKYSDLALIKKKLISKSERVQNSLKDRELVFKRQSDIKEGVWVVVSEDSPVKSGSIIKCTFKTSAKRSLHAATIDAAVMDPSSMPLVSNDEFIKELVVENVSTPVTIYDHSSQNVSTYDISHDNFFVLPQELIAENASSHSLRDASEGNCVLDNSETSTDIVDSSCDDHAQNIRSVAKNLKKRKLCLQSRNPPSKTTCLTTAVLKERREPTSVPLPANFNLPNRFRLDIQQKLDDSSSVFMAKDQSAFLREVANAIQLYSYKPSEFELANIVSEILLKYPHASSLPTAEAKHKDLIYKLKRIMERRRAELRIELSAKQKTKLRNDNHSDPTKCSQVAIDDTDETSYWKNVAKMFEIFEKGTVPYSDTVDALLKLTFSIRRALIMKWVPESGRMEIFMDKHCPFLKLQTFLFLEFELIMKK
ncbi:uncharacterized protein LOC116933858 [Daphnia magna]|uniref:uncharacterized protein LOC116933858 n=1 Tax=Daphnia magna TaxID=35525 RepID=UPI001E1BB9AE|nr:uncharacterized protein LOC116933858 [Daphnia magna]